jgi:DNA-binding LacI/PurR family transcriptional regulator
MLSIPLPITLSVTVLIQICLDEWIIVANRKRVTIIDVAEEAGVSKQTVSRVINDRPDVADHTRVRIKDIIRKLGYQPDPIARSMKGSTHTLGCITPNLSDYNFSSIVQAAQAEARKNGFFILTGSAQSEVDVNPLLDEFLSRRVDGILVINPRDDQRYKLLLPLIQQDIPIVYLKNTPENEQVSAVCLDDETGGYLATQHLLSLGHTEIVMILGLQNEECTQDRLAGFQKAYRDVGKEPLPSLRVHGDWSAASGNQAIKALLDQELSFSAVFAQNDRMAVGAIRAIREANLKVPQDVSVIGYDDIPLSSFFDPPITTIRQPMEEFGRIGAQLLIEAVNNPAFTPRTIRLDPELVLRETCSLYQP